MGNPKTIQLEAQAQLARRRPNQPLESENTNPVRYTPPMRTNSIFWISVVPAAAITWGVHELAHYQMGRWLGYDMWLSMNQVGLVSGGYEVLEHDLLVTMAGPLVTYVQAALALWLIWARDSKLAYPYLFLALFMRSIAFLVSFRNPNDEAQTSLDLGLAMWVVPSVAVAVLLGMTIAGNRALQVGWRTNALLYLLASVIVAAIVLADPVVGRILGG